ncbi:MAG: hypothetical protein ACKER6_00270 [Candidatus Hodgkinia cicadicola]
MNTRPSLLCSTLNYKNALSLQTMLLPNGMIPSRNITKFSMRKQKHFTTEVKRCRCVGMIPNHALLTI